MLKPHKLKQGDTIAIVSPSSGLAGEPHIRWRTDEAIRRIEDMGYQVKVMPNALNGFEWNYSHPKERASSLMSAFEDESVKAILCTIGGNESVRIIPFLKDEVIQQHPKIFIGYSDITALHLHLYQLGITTFYGPALLTDFAENGGNDAYTMDALFQLIQNAKPFGQVHPTPFVRKFGLRWDEQLRHYEREKLPAETFQVLNGQGRVTGHLIGGCFESLDKLRGTRYFPKLDHFDGAILFIETSEVHSEPWSFEDSLRSWALMGIFDRIKGLIVGRPHDGVYQEEYHQSINKILKEIHHLELIVLGNVSFGHNEPKATLPYGIQATIETETGHLYINESAVL